MNRIFLVVVCIGLTIAAARPAYSQDKKPAAPKPAVSPSQSLLDNWNDIGRKLIAMAEDFPEDKYDFKPTPAQHSFAGQLLHVASANYFFTNPVMGQKAPGEEDAKREDYKTRAAVVALLKKSFEDGAAAIKFKGDKGLSDLVVDPFANQETRVSDLGWGMVEHSGEIYGQLAVYYRVSGMVPPESRPKK
jgi:uncharacterized damage-inducible protein DinB